VRAVVGVQFGEDALDSALDGFFGDRELIRDLLVGEPLGNQTEDADFRRGQRLLPADRRLEQASAERTFPGVDHANRFHEFCLCKLVSAGYARAPAAQDLRAGIGGSTTCALQGVTAIAMIASAVISGICSPSA
jgi:hypothetical protein